MEIVSEQPMLMAEVRERLEKLQKEQEDEELNFRAQKTLDHVQQFSSLGVKKAKELYDAIAKLDIPRLRDPHITKLVDIMPATEAEVKVVLQGFAITVTAESMKKIGETVKPFVPKSKK